MEKASAADTAVAIRNGVEAGDARIFPNPLSRGVGVQHAGNPAAVDAAPAAMGR